MKQLGKILWWDRRDKEGVITDNQGCEFYFNASVFPDHARFKTLEGRFVQFTMNEEITHAKCAKSVALVPGESISKAKKTFESSKLSNSAESAA
ncbi:MAG: hypothetical protein AB7K68_15170 [Bacteriovoracia bacterium]